MVWAAFTDRSAAGRGLFETLVRGETANSGLDDVKTVIDIVGTLITAAAVIVGAVWAYFRFVKERTYRPRLEVSMGGTWLTVDEERLLLARVRVKNIGASVVQLLQKGTGLRVSSLADSDDARGAVSWVPGRVFPILEQHAWIEPNETFYSELASGRTIAQATVVARERSRAVGDPSWLAYVLYGRPEGTVALN